MNHKRCYWKLPFYEEFDEDSYALTLTWLQTKLTSEVMSCPQDGEGRVRRNTTYVREVTSIYPGSHRSRIWVTKKESKCYKMWKQQIILVTQGYIVNTLKISSNRRKVLEIDKPL